MEVEHCTDGIYRHAKLVDCIKNNILNPWTKWDNRVTGRYIFKITTLACHKILLTSVLLGKNYTNF